MDLFELSRRLSEDVECIRADLDSVIKTSNQLKTRLTSVLSHLDVVTTQLKTYSASQARKDVLGGSRHAQESDETKGKSDSPPPVLAEDFMSLTVSQQPTLLEGNLQGKIYYRDNRLEIHAKLAVTSGSVIKRKATSVGRLAVVESEARLKILCYEGSFTEILSISGYVQPSCDRGAINAKLMISDKFLMLGPAKIDTVQGVIPLLQGVAELRIQINPPAMSIGVCNVLDVVIVIKLD